MKVLVVTDSPEIWGAERSLADITAPESSTGVEYTVLAPHSSPVHEFLAARGVKTIRVTLPTHPALKRGGLQHARPVDLILELFAIARSSFKIARVAKGFDGVLSFALWRNCDALIGARLARVRALVDLHETFTGRMGMRLNGRLMSWFDAVIAPSRWILQQTGRPLRRSVVVPRMVEVGDAPAEAEDRAAVESVPIFGVFGQLQPHKGHALIIDAARKASARCRLKVLFVGSGGDRDVREMIEGAINADPQLFELRSVGRDDVVDLMARCRAVVNASEHEAFGRTMIEAAAAGTDPIAVGVGGPSEIVQSLGFGWVVNRSPESLADLLVELSDGVAPSRDLLDRRRVVGALYGRSAVSAAYSKAIVAGRSA